MKGRGLAWAFGSLVFVLVTSGCSNGPTTSETASPSEVSSTPNGGLAESSNPESTPPSTGVGIRRPGASYFELPPESVSPTGDGQVALSLVFLNGTQVRFETTEEVAEIFHYLVPGATVVNTATSETPPFRVSHGSDSPGIALGESLEVDAGGWGWFDPSMPSEQIRAVFVKRIEDWYLEVGSRDPASDEAANKLNEFISGHLTDEGFLVLDVGGEYEVIGEDGVIGRPSLTAPQGDLTLGCWNTDDLVPDQWLDVNGVDVALYGDSATWCLPAGVWIELSVVGDNIAEIVEATTIER